MPLHGQERVDLEADLDEPGAGHPRGEHIQKDQEADPRLLPRPGDHRPSPPFHLDRQQHHLWSLPVCTNDGAERVAGLRVRERREIAAAGACTSDKEQFIRDPEVHREPTVDQQAQVRHPRVGDGDAGGRGVLLQGGLPADVEPGVLDRQGRAEQRVYPPDEQRCSEERARLRQLRGWQSALLRLLQRLPQQASPCLRLRRTHTSQDQILCSTRHGLGKVHSYY